MVCNNCKKEIDNASKFCRFCGSVIEQEDMKIEKQEPTGFREKLVMFFDFGEKKGFWQSVLIYIVVAGLVILFHSFLPPSDISESNTYFLNAGMSFFAILIVSYLKGFKSVSWLLAVLAGVVGYLFGSFFGLVILFYPLMKDKKIDNVLENPARKIIVYHTLRAGVVCYLLGIFITAGSLVLAEEGGTYTIFYGLVVYGLYLFAKVVYFCANSSSLDRQIEKNLSKTEL